MNRISTLLAGALLAGALAAPAAAQADSIAYVKGGDVWLTTSDGARQYQVTFTGGYSDVSQADDGTMIALTGVRLHKLSRDGTVLADFDTPVSDTRPPGQKSFYGPYDPAISPDGSKLAYSFYYVSVGQNPGCYPPTCYTTVTEGGTAYSWADRRTAWDEPGLGKHTGWRNPQWLSNDFLMLSDPTHLPNRDVVFDRLGDTAVPVMDWFYDRTQGNTHVSGGDMTRTRDKLVFTVGDDDSAVRVYRVEQWPTQWPPRADAEYPLTCFQYGTGAKTSTPTWSPDGGKLAWANAEGLQVVAVQPFPGGCDPSRAQPSSTLLVAGATQPDWGPADVPAPRPPRSDPGRTPGTDPGRTPGTNPRTPGTNPGRRTPGTRPNALAAKASATTRGVTVKLTAPAAGRISASAAVKGKTVASVTRRVRRGAVAVTLRYKRAVKKGTAVKVRLSFKAARGPARSVTLSAKVR